MAATEDDYDREDSFLADSAPKAYRGTKGRRGGYGGFSAFDLPQPQDPIQPGSTEMGDSGRRYLAYNSLGAITLRQEEDHNVVEVTFHDTARMRKRVPLLSDFFGFTCGALGEKGALYASRSNADSASTVVYRPYESWAPNSDWSLTLPKGEEAECAAAGGSFCALATSRRHLRLFSQAGSQTHLLSLPGAPVALAARGHQLAAVWHGGPPTAAGDQCLHYALFDVAEQRQAHSGPLPLSPGSTLAWLGFTEEGLLAANDSAGELRLRSELFGGAWVTAFSAAAERKATEQYWVVGLSARELQAIVCANSPEPAVPSGNQRPVVTAVPLRPPVVAQDVAVAPFEADLIRHGALLSHVTAAAVDAKDAEDAAELESAVHQAQLEADRITLRLIQKLLAADRQARALEAVGTLHNMPALEGALKLANHHRATALADRISAFIEQRLALEAAAAELEEDEAYGEDAGGRQHGAVTPVPGPAFDDNHAASPAGGAATAGNMSRAPSPAPRAVVVGGGANPFARKTVEAPENSPGNASAVAAAAAKRKAPSSNPFARKSKAAKA
jgi:chromosome transmission fidelity protein 4